MSKHITLQTYKPNSLIEMVIVQIAIIFLFLAIGEVVVWATGIPVPSSIIGMLCLTAALQFKIVKLRWVSAVAEFLTANLGFFFIPAGVSLMFYFDVLKAQWVAIVVASVGSTLVVLWVTGLVHQYLRKSLSHHVTSGKQ